MSQLTIDSAILDISKRSKKGLSFIMASVVIWFLIMIIWLLPGLDTQTRNMFSFFCTAPLVPLALLFSKLIGAEFSIKNNPLNNLGLLFTFNQLLYIIIAMWAYSKAPTSMIMILTMIFGAHLLPFSWLYKSKSYLVFSIIIPILVLIIGSIVLTSQIYLIPLTMVIVEILFCYLLFREVKSIKL